MKEESNNHYFLVEEIKSLRGEIDLFLKQVEENEKLAIFSSGVIWSLVVSIKWNDALNIIIMIPSIITIVLYIKRSMLLKTIKKISTYIKLSENILSNSLGYNAGWENYRSRHKDKQQYMKWWARLFWLILFLTNTSLALFFPFQEILKK